MKLNQIALGVAALFAAGAASAATHTLVVSGATALNKSFEKTVSDMCEAGTSYAYTSGSGKTSVRYECNVKDGLGISGVADTDDLVIHKEGGGSSAGVTPVNNSATVPVATTTCTATTSGALIPGGPVWSKRTGCGNTTAVPHAGVSDVEPKLVGTATGNLINTGIVAQVFGIAVSDNIYQKLQAEQGKTVGDYSEAQAPSLPIAFVRGAFSGKANDWTALDPDITADVDRTQVANGGTEPNHVTTWDDANANTTAIKICRRATGSGTLATFEATVMQNPCAGTNAYGGKLALSTAASDDASQSGADDSESDVYHVVEATSAEAVDTCLTRAYYQGEMAMGILGTERLPGDAGTKTGGSDDNDGLTDKWHYVKLNQVYPSVANFVAGDYDLFWAEASFNRRTSGYSAVETALMNHIQAKMGSVDAITSLPLPGLAALTSNGAIFDYGVNPVSRAQKDGNTCKPSYQLY